MDALNICDELNQSIDGNPEENYKVFLKLIKDVKDNCLPKKVVKYNKKKHKKSKWMTSALLKSINTKNQLYKEWIKTDVNDLNLFFLGEKMNLSQLLKTNQETPVIKQTTDQLH